MSIIEDFDGRCGQDNTNNFNQSFGWSTLIVLARLSPGLERQVPFVDGVKTRIEWKLI
jgi:hypothetical protein